jgi:hypothetical protein
VDDHLEKRERGDLGAAEVVRVVGPGLVLLRLGLRRLVVAVDCVRIGGRRGDVVFKLPGLPCDRRRRAGLHRAAAGKRRGGKQVEEERRGLVLRTMAALSRRKREVSTGLYGSNRAAVFVLYALQLPYLFSREIGLGPYPVLKNVRIYLDRVF